MGRKARITASTRFNMPSVILLPWTNCRATCNTPRFMAALLWPVAMMRLAQVDQAVAIHFVMVDQRAARRFGNAYAFGVVGAGVRRARWRPGCRES